MTLLAAGIGALALILAAMVTVTIPLLVNIRRHAAQASDQLANSHTTNMRDENDQRHAAEMRLLRQQGRRLGRIETRLKIVETTQQRARRTTK